ncbi:MAG: MFS transporter [Bacteroidales bacterium]|nr:MFS transporter [Bacteroidales bacterium]
MKKQRKVKGLRWWVLSMILLVSIINYLDRGTLNYMWYVQKPNDVEAFVVTTEPIAGSSYVLINSDEVVVDGNVTATFVNMRYADNPELRELTWKLIGVKDQGDVIRVGDVIEIGQYSGIGLDLGLVDLTLSPKDAQDAQKGTYAWLANIFLLCYGISQFFSGRLYDKIGVRKGFVVSAVVWGAADMMASLARGFGSLAFFRGLLGLGEAGPWPGTTKSNAEWFPQKERATAQGLFGAAASVGSILAPIVISLLFLAFDWKLTFLLLGSLGIIWCIPWLIVNKKGPKEHPWITDEEREYILTGQPEAAIAPGQDRTKSYGEILGNPKNYSVILGRLFLDPIWWMFITWLPIYLLQVHDLNLKEVAATAWVPFLGAAIGSILGGVMSSSLIKRGRTPNFARKAAMLTGGVFILVGLFSILAVKNIWVIASLMGLVLGAYQFVATNIQTIPSDLHSGKSVGSLAGLGGVSAVIGSLTCIFTVPMITAGGNWTMFFILLAALVPLSLGSVFLTVGKIEPIK